MRREVLCEYDKTVAKGIIPRRVKTQEWFGKEKLAVRDITIISFQKSESLHYDFNLFGLGMEVGRIGYWDGEKLIDGLPRKDR